MNALARARHVRAWGLATVVLYALLVMSAPVLHHDFACHQKSPWHCVACVSSPSAPRATAKVVVVPVLSEIGRVLDRERLQFGERLLLSLPGRSPPA